jgi:peptidoglycan/LPS O-acetylase OafA/YrhL
VAVIAVLLYHAQLSWIPGGFLGVDVFFVISGYLITSLLLVEWRRRGRIDLPAFWLRRARRLLPALFLLITATLVFAVASLPTEVAGLRRDALAALGYVTNWYLVFSHQSYFETLGRPSLFRHLWSLAVEEQFYILWPPIFATIMWLRRPRLVLFALLTGAVASTVLMAHLYQPGFDPSRVYYGTDTRGVGLLIGAALAFLWAPGLVDGRAARLRPLLVDAVGLGALAVLFYAFFRFDGFGPFIYRGGFALVALASAVLIAAVVHPQTRLARGLLGRQPLRWLGVRSYGIYLWHWPVFMLTRPDLDVPIDGLPLLALRFVLTVLIADLSYRFVETPIRSGALGRLWRGLREAQGLHRWQLRCQWATAASAAMTSFVVLAMSVASAQRPAPPSYLAVESVHIVATAAVPTQTALTENVASAIPPTATPNTAVPVPSPAAPVPTPLPPTPTAAAPAVPPAAPTVEPTPVPQPAPTANAPAAPSAPPVKAAPVPVGSVAAAAPTPAPPNVPSQAAGQEQPPAPSASTPAQSQPAPPPPPAPAPAVAPPVRVTAIGDSVMLGAADALVSAIGNIEVDAVVGRQAWEAVNILRQYRDAGTLGDVVVVHMGNNGQFVASEFDQMMEALAAVHRVVFVSVKVPRSWEGPNNSMLAENVARYSNAVLVDWRAASIDHPEFFWDDGIHLRPEGAQAYAQLIAGAVMAP